MCAYAFVVFCVPLLPCLLCAMHRAALRICVASPCSVLFLAFRLRVSCTVLQLPGAGVPVGCVTEFQLRVDPFLPARPRGDYHVISSALNLRNGARVYVFDVGRLFCVATLERVLDANCPSLSAALNSVLCCWVESAEQLGACIRAACGSVRSRDYTALIVYGLASLYPANPTRCNVNYLFETLHTLVDLAADRQACVLLVNQVHFRDTGVYFSGGAKMVSTHETMSSRA